MNNLFSPWARLGPATLGVPAGAIVTAVTRWPGRIDLVGADVNGNLWLAPFDDGAEGTGWGSWVALGQLMEVAPDNGSEADPAVAAAAAAAPPSALVPFAPLAITAVQRGEGMIDLLMLPGDGSVLGGTSDLNPATAPGFRPICYERRGCPGTVLAAASCGPDHLRVFAVGGDGGVWTCVWDSMFDWEPWTSIDGINVDPCRRQRVAAVASPSGRVEVFAIDRGGCLVTAACDEGRPWDPWTPVGGEALFSPRGLVTALPLAGGELVLVAPASDGGVWLAARAPGQAFGAWTRLGDAGLLPVPPRGAVAALSRAPGAVELFVTGRDGGVYTTSGTLAAGFPPWARVEGLGGSIPAQAILTAVSCRPDRVDLFTARSDGFIYNAFRHDRGERLSAAGAPAPDGAPGAAPQRVDPLAAIHAVEHARAAAHGVGHRRALLVGINAYVDGGLPPLKYCVNDVRALEEALRGAGYDSIVTLHDEATEARLRPTRENIKVELMALAAALTADDLALVHFSCHGMLIGGKPHLLPASTRLKILAESALAVDEVMRLLSASAARRVVVLLDACHTGVEYGRDASGHGLTPAFVHNVYELAQGVKVFAGATRTQVARERDDTGRGVFTSFIVEALARSGDHAAADFDQKGFVTFDDLRNYVSNGVMAWSAEHSLELQLPNERGEGAGAMILVDYRAPTPAPDGR
jgi:hypothetical protein